MGIDLACKAIQLSIGLVLKPKEYSHESDDANIDKRIV